MMCLGLDPGPTRNGWALLDFTIPKSPVWFDHGVTEDVNLLCTALARKWSIDLVAIEQARALHNPLANVQAMATAWAGGEAAGIFKRAGFEVVALGVDFWRMAFVGHSRKGDNVDHKVEIALRQFVRGMPERTNVHVRDAAGVACVGARDWRPRTRLTGSP